MGGARARRMYKSQKGTNRAVKRKLQSWSLTDNFDNVDIVLSITHWWAAPNGARAHPPYLSTSVSTQYGTYLGTSFVGRLCWLVRWLVTRIFSWGNLDTWRKAWTQPRMMGIMCGCPHSEAIRRTKINFRKKWRAPKIKVRSFVSDVWLIGWCAPLP